MPRAAAAALAWQLSCRLPWLHLRRGPGVTQSGTHAEGHHHQQAGQQSCILDQHRRILRRSQHLARQRDRRLRSGSRRRPDPRTVSRSPRAASNPTAAWASAVRLRSSSAERGCHMRRFALARGLRQPVVHHNRRRHPPHPAGILDHVAHRLRGAVGSRLASWRVWGGVVCCG